MYKSFLNFVRKEFLHILRDWRTMLILLAMPVVQVLLFGFAISTEVRNVRVGVLAPHPNEQVRRLVERIGASERFSTVRVFRSEREIVPAFQRGEVGLALVFSADNSALQLLADGSEPNQAGMAVNYARRIIADAAGAGQNPAAHLRMLYNPQQRSAYNFVPGVMGLVLMLICAMMTSISIVREKETGTMEVLLASPLPAGTIVVAKLVPYFALSMVNIASILLLSVHVLGVPVRGSLALLLGICVLFVVLALALGLLVSTLTRSQAVAMLVCGMVMMMPVMLLSGMVFPVESMPRVLQWMSAAVPARWFIAAVKKVMLQGCCAAEVWREVAVLAAMAAGLLAVSMRLYKQRLE